MSPWLQLSISGLSGALLFSPLATLLDHFLEDAEGVLSVASVANEALNIAPPITVAWIAINAPFVLGLRLTNTGRGEVRAPADAPAAREAVAQRADDANRSGEVDSDGEGSAPASPSRQPGHAELPFMRLVAPSLRGRVIYLQAELHYLAVVTDLGRSLILYNLRDAVHEISGEEAAC